MTKINDGLRLAVYPVAVIEDKSLSAYAKLLYMILRSFVTPYSDQAFPSVDTLARLASVSRRTVQRAISELEDKGYIKKEARHDAKTNRQTSNVYILTLPEGVTQTRGRVSHRHGGGCHTDTGEGVTQTPEYNHKEYNQKEYTLNECNREPKTKKSDIRKANEIEEIIEKYGAKMIVKAGEKDGITYPLLSMAEYKEELMAALARRRILDKETVLGAIDVWCKRQRDHLASKGYYLDIRNPIAFYMDCMSEFIIAPEAYI